MMTRRKLRTQILSAVRLMRSEFVNSPLFDPAGTSQLVSLSIIGEPIEERPIDRVMDVDTLVIVRDPMTDEKHAEVESVFEKVKAESETDHLSVSYELKDGPIKPGPAKDVNLFFHVLLHTVSSYQDSPLILVKNSWQYEARRLLGMEIGELESIPGVTRSELLEGKLGIRHSRDLLESRASACLEWGGDSGDELKLEMRSIEFDESFELLELCYYVVLRAASNALRYVLDRTEGVGIGADDMRLFSVLFEPMELSGMPFKYSLEKERLRDGEWYPKPRELKVRVEQAFEFLDNLEEFIASHSRKHIIGA